MLIVNFFGGALSLDLCLRNCRKSNLEFQSEFDCKLSPMRSRSFGSQLASMVNRFQGAVGAKFTVECPDKCLSKVPVLGNSQHPPRSTRIASPHLRLSLSPGHRERLRLRARPFPRRQPHLQGRHRVGRPHQSASRRRELQARQAGELGEVPISSRSFSALHPPRSAPCTRERVGRVERTPSLSTDVSSSTACLP